MSDTVFILGAGASHKAGAPMLANFLDVARALDRTNPENPSRDAFKRVFAGIAELGGVYEKARLDSDNLEAVFAAFEMAALFGRLGRLDLADIKALPDAMRSVIVRTLESTLQFPVVGQSLESRRVSAPYPYLDFVKMFDRTTEFEDKVAIITFNYDLAIDYALHESGRRIDYGLEAQPMVGGFPLLKLHGSLNWLECHQCGVAPYRLEEFFRVRRFDTTLISNRAPFQFRVSAALAEDPFPHCNGDFKTPRVPLLVPPTWNKGDHHQRIARVWARAAQHLSEARQIAIIGYSLPESDHFFRLLWALGTVGPTRIENLWVVNPSLKKDTELDRRYRSMLGDVALRRYKRVPMTFENALERIQKAFFRRG